MPVVDVPLKGGQGDRLEAALPSELGGRAMPVAEGVENGIDELAAVTGYFGHPEPPERVIPSTTGQPQTSRGGEDVTVIKSGTTPDTARGTT